MKTISINLDQDIEFLNLYVLSDWHIGDKACKIDDIKAHIERIREDKNAVVICNGDLLNNATKSSVSDSYAETMNPQQQIEMVTMLLEPIKEKIIGFANGNHEARTYRESGIDLSSCICSRIGILDRYANEGGVIFLRFGMNKHHKNESRRQCYTIYFTHGSGGGRKEGAKAIRLADMSSIVDVDVYIHSHTHLPMIMKESSYRVTPCSTSVQCCEKLFVNSSAQLSYGGYGQRYEFKPSSTAFVIVRLNGSKREMRATME